MIEIINQNLELSESEIINQVEKRIKEQYKKTAEKISPMAAANHLIDISEKSREFELEYSELTKQDIKGIKPLIEKYEEGVEFAQGILQASKVLEYEDIVPLRINGLEKQVNIEDRIGLGDDLNDRLNRLVDHIRHYRYFSMHTLIVSHLIEEIIVANYPPEINSTIDKDELLNEERSGPGRTPAINEDDSDQVERIRKYAKKALNSDHVRTKTDFWEELTVLVDKNVASVGDSTLRKNYSHLVSDILDQLDN
ncbi:hypothetical protein ACG2F4_07260 [Halalkalibaculum sp. DA3122]|uniref:hypothetical protein n=1 Tax=Halalkalibaculum sp. DA3122 TaxID=3373607 RepID=UPI003754E5D9